MIETGFGLALVSPAIHFLIALVRHGGLDKRTEHIVCIFDLSKKSLIIDLLGVIVSHTFLYRCTIKERRPRIGAECLINDVVIGTVHVTLDSAIGPKQIHQLLKVIALVKTQVCPDVKRPICSRFKTVIRYQSIPKVVVC